MMPALTAPDKLLTREDNRRTACTRHLAGLRSGRRELGPAQCASFASPSAVKSGHVAFWPMLSKKPFGLGA
jgi:hypothetical protein